MNARALTVAAVAFLITLPAFGQPEVLETVAGATVLCYHIVESPQDARMEVSRETFRQHLQYLEMTGYNVIPLRHLYEFVAGERASIPKNSVVITIDDGWRSAYTEAYPELKKRNFPFTLFIYPNIIGKTPIALSWEQVREMSDNGADIQSHSYSHPFLTKRMHRSFDDAKYASWLHRELAESKRVIEKHTGKKVEFLAYPYGDYDTRVAKMASKTGYAAALTCDFGLVKKGSNPFRMKRFVIDKRMDFAEFRKYLGASPMQLASMTPPPGPVKEPRTQISARLPNPDAVDPGSVGMAVLSLGQITPYSYDASTGEVSVTIDEPIGGKSHRAVVWAYEAKTGKRVEASWTFTVAERDEPAVVSPPAAKATATPARTTVSAASSVKPAPSSGAVKATMLGTATLPRASGAAVQK